MRLRQIKLSGFKSFADPTLIELRDAFSGIVGPNGCGKSNIIDAVRWVLGEGRVSELRGSSTMSELIFAGSTTRAPMGRASVELVLDNADGTLKGPWGQFSEVSVRRVVTRDGTSAYFINHQPVRRRDVQEIFMGTGLGARSYAIISQGMIASFIRAKPEELRGYIEEAAAVSLYKERRRETETLLKQTEENLARVDDLQAVKAQGIEQLKADAEKAAQWKQLDDKKRESESLWYFLQFEEARLAAESAQAEMAKKMQESAEKRAALEDAEAAEASLEDDVRSKAAAHDAAEQAVRGAEMALARLEGEMKRVIEKRIAAERELAQALDALAEKRKEAERIEREREEALTRAQSLKDAEVAEEETLAELEEALAAADEALQAQERQAQAAAALRARAQAASDALERSYATAAARLEEIQKRLTQTAQSERELPPADPEKLERVREQASQAQASLEEAQASLEEAQAALFDASQASNAADEAYFEVLGRLNAALARLEVLEEVDRNAQASGKAGQWRQAAGLADLPELADNLQIEPAWVRAFEAVLERGAQALLLRDLRTVAGFDKAQSRPPVRTTFAAPIKGIDARADQTALEAAPSRRALAGSDGRPLARLADHVRLAEGVSREAVSEALNEWLADVWTAESLDEALRLKDRLPEGGRLVTPQGDVVTRASVSFWAADDPGLSVLSRRQDLADLRRSVETLERQAGEADDARAEARRRAADARSSVEPLKVALSRATEASRAARDALAHETAAFEAAKRREADLAASREELERELEVRQGAAAQIESQLDEAGDALERAKAAAESAAASQSRAAARVRAVERDFTNARHASQMRALSQKQAQEALEMIERRRTALKKDLERERAREAAARQILQQEDRAALESDAADQLEKLDAVQKQAAAAKNALEVVRGQRDANARVVKALRAQLLPLSDEIGSLKAVHEQKSVLSKQLGSRMDELGADWTAMAVLAQVRQAKASAVKTEVTKLMNAIEALGPVNHAALEQLQAAEASLAETTRQIEDLRKAIETLEAAIRKIDAETRARMRETFDKVNANFDECFKGLFGGGRAELVMTGDEILSAGIEVIAQPPGKRNASTRLLSGGEQALTATALVFAMFGLNPAPFCLLDEVDAPLDEANQGRLASLCRKMSQATQFLVITHNRVTMAYCEALIGVTMKEPGVSRVVSVDIEEAMAYAQEEAADEAFAKAP